MDKNLFLFPLSSLNPKHIHKAAAGIYTISWTVSSRGIKIPVSYPYWYMDPMTHQDKDLSVLDDWLVGCVEMGFLWGNHVTHLGPLDVWWWFMMF